VPDDGQSGVIRGSRAFVLCKFRIQSRVVSSKWLEIELLVSQNEALTCMAHLADSGWSIAASSGTIARRRRSACAGVAAAAWELRPCAVSRGGSGSWQPVVVVAGLTHPNVRATPNANPAARPQRTFPSRDV